MFSVEESPTLGVQGDKKWVVDPARSVWMQRVSSYLTSSVDALELHVGDRVFLVERERWQVADGKYASRIESLGSSAIARLNSNIVSDSFVSDEDRHQVGLLAAEAILVYGSYYNGSSDPAVNTQTVEFDGKTYVLADFVRREENGHVN